MEHRNRKNRPEQAQPGQGLVGATASSLVAQGLSAALEVVLPTSCAGCGLPGRSLCSWCWAQLRPDPAGPLRGWAGEGPLRVPVWSAGPYAHELSRTLLAFKERRRIEAAPVLAPLLREVLEAALSECRAVGAARGTVLLVPVPSHPSALLRRWFRPVPELLDRAGPLPGTAVFPVLRRTPSGLLRGPQKARGAAQRRRALQGSLRAAPVPGQECLVVDDVLTSGATVLESVRALRAAGGRVLGAVTVAAVVR